MRVFSYRLFNTFDVTVRRYLFVMYTCGSCLGIIIKCVKCAALRRLNHPARPLSYQPHNSNLLMHLKKTEGCSLFSLLNNLNMKFLIHFFALLFYDVLQKHFRLTCRYMFTASLSFYKHSGTACKN